MNRHGDAYSDAACHEEFCCHGEYFEGARAFLERDRFSVLMRAVSSRVGRGVRLDEMGEVGIILMKHGAFYHPARVTVAGFSLPLCFVLNVAASEAGRHILEAEYLALEKLGRSGGKAYVPGVYGKTASIGSRCLAMFLGDWFHGFHEFHLSRDPGDGRDKIRVWDEGQGAFFLGDVRTRELYHQAAFILTHYYNPLTFEQIFPWHHAAGDFVLRIDAGGLQMRLITVRGYGQMFRGVASAGEGGLDQTMAALLIFLLNLSIRMRIDRLDGTGELAWAGEETVTPMWQGFCRSLAGMGQGTGDLLDAFRSYLSAISLCDGLDLALAAAGGFHPQAPERALLERHLEAHVASLWGLAGHDR